MNYAISLLPLDRFEEVKSLLRKTIPMARRVLGESDETTLRMRYGARYLPGTGFLRFWVQRKARLDTY